MEAQPDTRSVFVVHGRDERLRRAMFDFLRSIDLLPIEWTTAIELTRKGSPYIGEVLDAAFSHATAVVVLMTPDEVAYLQPTVAGSDTDPETQPATQARPNVLFEAGMALGRHPERTIIVEVGDVRPFSDVAGRHTVRLTNDVRRRQELATRLRTAGCAVDTAGIDWHDTGDFTPPPNPGHGLPLGRRIPSKRLERPPVDFDLRYINKGGNRIDKLQIINRGTETAYDVVVSMPTDAALGLLQDSPIAKIPGGKSVTIDVMNDNRMMGGVQNEDAFDVTIAARLETGQDLTQDVFIDVNG